MFYHGKMRKVLNLPQRSNELNHLRFWDFWYGHRTGPGHTCLTSNGKLGDVQDKGSLDHLPGSGYVWTG